MLYRVTVLSAVWEENRNRVLGLGSVGTLTVLH